MFETLREIYSISKIFFNLTSYLFIYKLCNKESIFFADKLINSIKNSRNVYWKLCQWTTSRIELQFDVDKNYLIQKLKHFYEKCPYHTFNYTKKVIENYYCKPIEDIFYSISEIPEASGSIGQVHMGVLIKNNQKVALKVRHPKIDDSFKYFCKILNTFNEITKYLSFLKLLSFDLNGLDEFMTSQINFVNEAHNLKKLKNLFKDQNYVLIPEVYEYDEEFILMEYIAGEIIDNVYENDKELHREMMIKLWMFVRESILLNGFTHADLHKGNWKVNGNNLVIYDLGLVFDNLDDFEINKLIFLGFESRSPELISYIIGENLLYDEEKEKVAEELRNYLETNMDKYNFDIGNDFRLLVRYLNKNKLILKFRAFSCLISFNVSSSNYKNFFCKEKRNNFFELQLDRYAILKEKSKELNNLRLLERLELDESLFIEINKDIIKKIYNEKDKKLELIDDILDELTDEE